jgi:hypothetical protein
MERIGMSLNELGTYFFEGMMKDKRKAIAIVEGRSATVVSEKMKLNEGYPVLKAFLVACGKVPGQTLHF